MYNEEIKEEIEGIAKLLVRREYLLENIYKISDEEYNEFKQLRDCVYIDSKYQFLMEYLDVISVRLIEYKDQVEKVRHLAISLRLNTPLTDEKFNSIPSRIKLDYTPVPLPILFEYTKNVYKQLCKTIK